MLKRLLAFFFPPEPIRNAPVWADVRWEDTDAEVLKGFLMTDTGHKLQLYIMSQRAARNALACSEIQRNREFAAGTANGWTEVAAHLRLMTQTRKEAEGKRMVLSEQDPSEEEIEETLAQMASGARQEVIL